MLLRQTPRYSSRVYSQLRHNGVNLIKFANTAAGVLCTLVFNIFYTVNSCQFSKGFG